MSILPRLHELHSEMTSWRRDLHAHPQTAFEETYASDFIAHRLEQMGIPIERGLATTGVVGTLEGKAPASGRITSIGLRADIDALDIEEQNAFDYRSTNQGKMHACGHDGHTTMLLGAAQYLAETRNFSGTVQLIFQPAEENEAGARVMVEEGLFDRFPVDSVFGLHNWPGLGVGEMAVQEGPIMAACDTFTITIEGEGAHGAMPHQGIDPVVVASHVVTALQTIASRTIDPLDQVVVTVTQIHAGDTWNVIPSQAVLRGTARSFHENVQEKIEASLQQISKHVARAFGATADVAYDRRYPATVNTAQETAWVGEVADRLFGSDHVTRDANPSMGAEDFAFMLQQRPGCYVWLGNGIESVPVHNPRYDFNDAILPIGATYWSRLVETLLPV